MATEIIKTTEKSPKNNWTSFWDMHSGGGTKTPYEMIFIEADEEEAIKIFKDKFDQDPTDTACSCCGQNFSIDSYKSLEEATEFHRQNYTTKGLISIEAYSKKDSVLIMYK